MNPGLWRDKGHGWASAGGVGGLNPDIGSVRLAMGFLEFCRPRGACGNHL